MKIFRIINLLFFPCVLIAQTPTNTHFMGSSLIFMPSTENIGAKNLVFRFNHRFGNAKSGFENFYGLDDGANTHLALDYGITDDLMVGIARTSADKTWELRTKYKIISQDSFPLTISFFGAIGQETSDQSYKYNYFNRNWTGNSVLDTKLNGDLNTYTLSDQDKRSYLSSLLISRKWTDSFTVQASPMYVHRNFTQEKIGNARVGLDISGRFKITNRLDFSFSTILTPKRDYFGENYTTESQKTSQTSITQLSSDQINLGLTNGSISLTEVILKNIILDEPVKHKFIPIGIGIDLETGGHVFQFFVANTRSLAHTQLLRGADFDTTKKEFCLGFNIMRQFSFAEEKEKW
ncbi:MAG: DUF5777 family beta-barrel protein [Leptospira sp.]|nr:DUF5777 family beta-barrel protein [Leptospira sp.]